MNQANGAALGTAAGTIHSSAIYEGLNQSSLALRMKQMANKY